METKKKLFISIPILFFILGILSMILTINQVKWIFTESKLENGIIDSVQEVAPDATSRSFKYFYHFKNVRNQLCSGESFTSYFSSSKYMKGDTVDILVKGNSNCISILSHDVEQIFLIHILAIIGSCLMGVIIYKVVSNEYSIPN